MPKDKATPPSSEPPEAAFIGMPKKVSALLEKESERGAILILGAYLEEILSLIVRASCTSDRLGKELLEYRKPAGDFSSKITLCESFGLISLDEAAALNVLRGIRNGAAHFDQKGRGFDVLFDSTETAEQVRAFLQHFPVELTSNTPESLRNAFVVASRFLAGRLYTRLFKAVRPAPARPSKEEADTIRVAMKDTAVGQIVARAENLAKSGNSEALLELIETASSLLQKHFVKDQPSPP